MRTTVRWVGRNELEQIVLHVLRRFRGCEGLAGIDIAPAPGPSGHWALAHFEYGTAAPDHVKLALQQAEAVLLARYLLAGMSQLSDRYDALSMLRPGVPAASRATVPNCLQELGVPFPR